MAFLAVYTWAKSLDDKSAAAGLGATNAFAGHMDNHDPRLVHETNGNDLRNEKYEFDFPDIG
jgi:hypothetical protein